MQGKQPSLLEVHCGTLWVLVHVPTHKSKNCHPQSQSNLQAKLEYFLNTVYTAYKIGHSCMQFLAIPQKSPLKIHHLHTIGKGSNSLHHWMTASSLWDVHRNATILECMSQLGCLHLSFILYNKYVIALTFIKKALSNKENIEIVL